MEEFLMTISRVTGSYSHGSTGQANSLTFNLNLTPQVGDSLVACIGTRDYSANRTVSSVTSSGVNWSRQAQTTSSSLQVSEIWLGSVQSTPQNNSVTISFVGNASINATNAADICEYNIALIKDGNPGGAQASSQVLDTGLTSSVTQGINELWVGTGCSGYTIHYNPSPTSFVDLDGQLDPNGIVISYLEWIPTSTSGNAECTESLGVATGWVGCIAAFKTITAIIELTSSVDPVSGNLAVLNDIFGFSNGRFVGPSIALPLSSNRLTLKDASTNYGSNLFLIIDKNDFPNDPTKWTPLLATDQTVIVKKDFQVGGLVSSAQGNLSLGGGFTSQIDQPSIKLFLSDVNRLSGSPTYNIDPIPQSASDPQNPMAGQVYINTGNNHLYKYTGSQWTDLGPSSNFNTTYETLQILRADGVNPANMRVGGINCISIQPTDRYVSADGSTGLTQNLTVTTPTGTMTMVFKNGIFTGYF
jgi:hypothetical protein